MKQGLSGWRNSDLEGQCLIDLSIIIPAFNEEELLPAALKSCFEATREAGLESEIIVVDNNSTDATSKVAEAGGARVVFESHQQISRARNAGAAQARAPFLVFLDADTTLPAELLQKAVARLKSGTCCGGGAVLQLGEIPLNERSDLGAKVAGLWNWLSIKRRLACGCFVFCLRDGFEAAGGFSEKVYAGEEIWFSRRVAKWGKPKGMKFQIIESPPIVSSDRKLEWHSNWRLFCQVTLLLLFPFLSRHRWACGIWYKRD